ncbi:MAG: DUF4405 domain-containing protein [Thermodesulfobacteriota bacterium]|nr:DUF4405 domain-containing protein [Thermodesulfobacteriota bacterium]
MKKNQLKYIIDISLFINMCSIAVIGLLLGFILTKGRVGGSQKYFLGLHRHEWGDIHLYLSFLFLILMVFHICFNWTWIIQSTKRYFKNHWKTFLLFVSFAWIIVLFIGWIAVRV